MMIRIGIIGYGNLGKGTELAIKQNPDMELVAIFTRRNPEDLKTITGAKVVNISEIENWLQEKIVWQVFLGIDLEEWE